MATIIRLLGNLRIWPGPILAVELVTTARRTRYFVLRVLYAIALLAAFVGTYLVTIGWSYSDLNSMAQFASAFFVPFGILQLTLVLVIGPALAAGTIAQERERRTLEYLYTTPLSSLEIIIGKLGGRVLQILLLVLSGVPVLALAMLLGGIAPLALLWLTVITMSTVLSVTMVSMAVSAWTAKARDAVILAYLLFFCLWILPYPLAALLYRLGLDFVAPVIDQLYLANPVTTFAMICTGESSWGPLAEPWSYVLALVRNQLLAGAVALVPATLLMRRIHLRETAGTLYSGSTARRRRGRIRLFQGQIGDNPMYWKELHAETGALRLGLLGRLLLVIILIVVCGSTIYAVAAALQQPNLAAENYCGYAIAMSTFLGCCGLLLVVVRAAGAITAEKERDCWASLISTPLEPGQIIKAKVVGSIWSLRGLMPLLAVVWLPAVLLRPSFFLSIPFTLLALGVLAVFAAMLGVYCSQCSQNTLRATAPRWE